ncbi:MAG: hypothetical protein R2762_09855 [Bryobacteraceae bacterium]
MSPAAEVPDFVSWLQRIQACPQGVRWARDCRSILDAGEACPNSEWLLWTVREAGFADPAVGRSFTAACLARVRRLLPDPRQQQALALLESVAAGAGSERDCAEAARLAAEAQADLAMSPEWSASAAAAGAALWHAAAEDPWAASAEVRRHCLRAMAWDPWAVDQDVEDRTLATALKALLRPHGSAIVAAIRERFAANPPKPPKPCGGC